MRRIRVNNPDLTRSEKSYLTSAYTTGTTLNVVNSFAFEANNFAVIGEPGKDETIESERISAIPSAGLTITIASILDYDYNVGTVVYMSRYDQVSIESRASSTATWAAITTSGIQWDKLQTLYVDANGIETTQYRWRFYNSSTLEYSAYSPTLTGAGFTENHVGYILREVRLLTGDLDGRVKKDREIIRDIARAQEIIYGRMPNAWFFRIEDSTITTTASVFKYNLDTINSATAGSPTITIQSVDTVRYRYNDGTTDNTWHLTFLPNIEFDEKARDNDRADDDNVAFYTILDPDASSINGYIQTYPTPKTTGRGTFYIRAYQKPDAVNTVDDKVSIPVPSIIIDYCVAQVERVRGNDTKAGYYEELFYGPAGTQQDNRRLTGIALLEQMNEKQRHPQGQPRSLFVFKGRRAMKRMFGTQNGSRDFIKENYFD